MKLQGRLGDFLPQPNIGTPGCAVLILATLGDAGVTGLGVEGILSQPFGFVEVEV